jgi:hypothetical protein
MLTKRQDAQCGDVQRSRHQALIAEVSGDDKAEDVVRRQGRTECEIDCMIDRASNANVGSTALLRPLADVVRRRRAGSE